MSAYDDFCGCGDYACHECFGGLAAPTTRGNAWMDEALVEKYPTSAAAKVCLDRLIQHGMRPEVPPSTVGAR